MGWEGKSALVSCPFLHCLSIARPHSGVHAVERSGAEQAVEWSGVERMKRTKRSQADEAERSGVERSEAEWSGVERSGAEPKRRAKCGDTP